jgi:hypothetical protein
MAEKLYRNRFLLGAAGSVNAIHARIQEPLGKTKRNLKNTPTCTTRTVLNQKRASTNDKSEKNESFFLFLSNPYFFMSHIL